MKAKLSPLKLHDFKLLQANMQFIAPDNAEVNPEKLFEKYSVDIDFSHHEENEEEIRVFVKIEINQGKKPKVGYQLSAEGFGLFGMPADGSLSDAARGNLKYFSTLNMVINNLRNVLYQLSNLAPFGPYILPPIDIVDLMRQKQERIK